MAYVVGPGSQGVVYHSIEELDSPLDQRDVTSRNKILRDLSFSERQQYIKGIYGYVRKSIVARRYVRPIRYVTKTEAYYLLQKPQNRSITAPIESSIVRTFPIETYAGDTEEMILIAVPDEERAAYPEYPILWQESDLNTQNRNNNRPAPVQSVPGCYTREEQEALLSTGKAIPYKPICK
jgi:hypothetical protein